MAAPSTVNVDKIRKNYLELKFYKSPESRELDRAIQLIYQGNRDEYDDYNYTPSAESDEENESTCKMEKGRLYRKWRKNRTTEDLEKEEREIQELINKEEEKTRFAAEK